MKNEIHLRESNFVTLIIIMIFLLINILCFIELKNSFSIGFSINRVTVLSFAYVIVVHVLLNLKIAVFDDEKIEIYQKDSENKNIVLEIKSINAIYFEKYYKYHKGKRYRVLGLWIEMKDEKEYELNINFINLKKIEEITNHLKNKGIEIKNDVHML